MRFLLVEAKIPLGVVLGEALVEFVKDDLRLSIHDAKAVLAAGEMVVGEW